MQRPLSLARLPPRPSPRALIVRPVVFRHACLPGTFRPVSLVLCHSFCARLPHVWGGVASAHWGVRRLHSRRQWAVRLGGTPLLCHCEGLFPLLAGLHPCTGRGAHTGYAIGLCADDAPRAGWRGGHGQPTHPRILLHVLQLRRPHGLSARSRTPTRARCVRGRTPHPASARVGVLSARSVVSARFVGGYGLHALQVRVLPASCALSVCPVRPMPVHSVFPASLSFCVSELLHRFSVLVTVHPRGLPVD